MLLVCATMLALLPCCCCMTGVACTAAILSQQTLYQSSRLSQTETPWPLRPGVTREEGCQSVGCQIAQGTTIGGVGGLEGLISGREDYVSQEGCCSPLGNPVICGW